MGVINSAIQFKASLLAQISTTIFLLTCPSDAWHYELFSRSLAPEYYWQGTYVISTEKCIHFFTRGGNTATWANKLPWQITGTVFVHFSRICYETQLLVIFISFSTSHSQLCCLRAPLGTHSSLALQLLLLTCPLHVSLRTRLPSSCPSQLPFLFLLHHRQFLHLLDLHFIIYR